MGSQKLLDTFNAYLNTHTLTENYKETPEYKNQAAKVFQLRQQLNDLKSKLPKKTYPSDEEMMKASGFTADDWKDLSKSEKQTYFDLFNSFLGEDDYDKWFDEYRKVNKEYEEAYEVLSKMKETEYNNQYSNKDVSLGTPTNKTEFEGFKADTGEFRQDYLSNMEYAKTKGYTDIYIAEMTPDEYMHACAKYIFQTPIEDAYDGMEQKGNVEKYAEIMKSGEKFDMPYIDLKTQSQEGRHRALAAKQLGIEKIPVLILK